MSYFRQLVRRGAVALGLKSAPPAPKSYDEIARERLPLYNKPVPFGSDGNAKVATVVAGRAPFMVCRLGSNELSVVAHYVRERQGRGGKPYPQSLVSQITTIAGFFPGTDAALDRFAQLMLDSMPHADLIGVWFNDFEDELCNRYAPQADLVELGSLEPFHYQNPWSAALAGRRVLVVHPFAESIARQYRENRTRLFADPRVLPEFQLTTLKAVQSVAGTPTGFADWFEAYDSMCAAIGNQSFDVAIIGAGAYGLPLAAHVKKLGRQAIHMGGVTQILFGIRGKRWEQSYPYTAKHFNEYWIRPLPSETPDGHGRVEDSCYW